MGSTLKLKKSQKKQLLMLASAVLLLCIVISFLITKIVYDAVFIRYEPVVCHDGEVIDCPALTTTFMSGKNELSALLYRTDSDSVIVIAQGMNSHAENYKYCIEAFTAEGFDVFIFDMTGSCQSEGESAVGFSQSVYDLDCALDHIERKYDYDDVFLFGHSRGGYAASCMLAERDDIDAVVSIGSVNSAMEAVICPAEEKIGFLAYVNYPMLWVYQTMLFDAATVSYSSADIIQGSDVPVLIAHGEEDSVVSIEKGSLYSHKDEVTRAGVEFLRLSSDHTTPVYNGENGECRAFVDTAIDFFIKNTEKGGD